MVRSYQDLEVWQLSMLLAKEVERAASRLPPREQYALASQLRRASSSIPSNIAEGSVRPTRVYIHHLLIALGSEAETKTQLRLAVNLKYLTESKCSITLDLASQVGRMLRGLVKSLRAYSAKRDRITP